MVTCLVGNLFGWSFFFLAQAWKIWSVLWLLHHLSFSALVVLQLFFQVALVFLPPVQSARSNNDLADAGRRKTRN